MRQTRLSKMSSDSCELSTQGRAFSTILTAFIGSIVNGISSGAIVAFMTGWISWFAVVRVLSGSLIGLFQAFSPDYAPLEQIEMGERGVQNALRPKALNNRTVLGVTVLGWMGWLYTAVYSPIVQILWLAENWGPASGSLKIIRALAISVSALSLTIDTKKRYAERLRTTSYLGSPACSAFKIINGFSAFSMGLLCAALLIKGAIDLGLHWYFYVIYCVFCLIWAAGSFSICPVQDGGIKGFGIIGDVLMGAFAGVFVAAPAFAIMQTAQQPTIVENSGSYSFSTPESGQASLKEYLSCDSVAAWQKFVAIFP